MCIRFSRICPVETFFGKELLMKRMTLLLVAVAMVTGLVAT